MKRNVCLLLLLWTSYMSYAGKPDKFIKIDAKARNTGYYPLKELAQKLTAPYSDEESKVRSVFIWITGHIAYDVVAFKSNNIVPPAINVADSALNFVLAKEALQKKRAVCAGYAALFKVLCDYSGLKAVIIEGNGRWPDDIGKSSASNHAWNAVMIGNEWKLLDATWASGAVNSDASKFERAFNPAYYCIAPALMILDHYPDSARWQLLPEIVTKKAYDHKPFITVSADPGLIPISYKPKNGMLERVLGDSIVFELELPGAFESISVWDEQHNDIIYYYPVPQANVKPVDQSMYIAPPMKPATKKKAPAGHAKPPSARNNKAVDDILAYVESIKDEAPPAAAEGNGSVSSQQVTTTGQTPDIEEPEIITPYFYRNGNKIKFTYPLKRKGSYLLYISLNDKVVMDYMVYVP